MSECRNKCPMCNKQGLPILLTRYAIAPAEVLARPLHGSFFTHSLIPLGGGAQYTLRLLRSGYVYTYDQARRRWRAYFVTPDAYLLPVELPQSGSATPAVTCDPAGIQPCSRSASATIAGCITISDPANAGVVWFAFSDVEWTPEVLMRHQDRAYRQRHMRSFDVGRWLAAGEHPYAGSMKRQLTDVAEYAPSVFPRDFDFTPAGMALRRGNLGAQALIETAESILPGKAAVLALDDPAGVAIELGALIDHRLVELSGRHEHPLSTSTAISTLMEHLAHQAEHEVLANADRHRARMIAESPVVTMTDWGLKLLEDTTHVKPEQLQEARARAWDKYRDKYDEPARERFQRSFEEALKRLDDEHISPLAQAHAAWMRSAQLASSFECNYDPADAESGVVYTATLNACIGNTQDKGACLEVYAAWLDGDLDDKQNLLLRGLVLNQDSFARIIEEGSASTVNPRNLPWGGMIGTVGQSVDNILDGRPDILGALMLRVGGAILQKVKDSASSGRLPKALVAMGVVSKAPVLPIEFVGNLKDFQKHVLKTLMDVRGEPVPPRGLVAAINNELRLLEIKGVNLAGTRSKRFLVLADLEDVQGVPATGRQGDRARALSKTLASVEDLEKVEMGRWRRNVEARFNRAASAAGELSGTLPYAFSVLGAIVQLYAHSEIARELEQARASGDNLAHAELRHHASWMALAGFSAEILGRGMENSQRIRSRLGAGRGKHVPLAMKVLGRGVGLIGAAIFGVLDAVNGLGKIEEGRMALGIGYFAVGILGIFGAIFILFTAKVATLIGLILISIAMGIALLIELFKDNPIQHWLSTCYFGSAAHRSAESELRALERAGAY